MTRPSLTSRRPFVCPQPRSQPQRTTAGPFPMKRRAIPIRPLPITQKPSDSDQISLLPIIVVALSARNWRTSQSGSRLRPGQETRLQAPMRVLFLHGWQSTPGGIKPTYLKDHGHEVLNPALPDDDFEAAVRIAQAEFDQHRPDVVVGSSRGGAVAMNIDAGSTPLVLLCPAWKRWGTATTVKPGTVILHSKADEVVPFCDSVELVRNSGLPSESLIVVGHEHRLADPESLARMLEAVEKAALPG